jgi:misacylated tRNA(Ala) deacylase
MSGCGDLPFDLERAVSYISCMPTQSEKQIDPRMHSAEHILNGTMVKTFGCARSFTAHLEKKKSKCDYRFERDLTADETKALEARVNQVISSDAQLREEFLDRPTAALQYDLDRLPEDAGETVRIIHVGDYDACPCSGPHVRSTREIGTFRIVSTTHENGILRIRFKLDA